MITYRIGQPAATLVSLTITFDGTIIPGVRQRGADGEMADVVENQLHPAENITAAEFIVRVDQRHVGVIELRPSRSDFVFAHTVIPLGGDRPFLDNELPPTPGANGAFSLSEEVLFRLAGHTLSWEAENMSGQAVLNELYPELTVVLRLPPGNRGAVVFATPLFARADGVPEGVIAAA